MAHLLKTCSPFLPLFRVFVSCRSIKVSLMTSTVITQLLWWASQHSTQSHSCLMFKMLSCKDPWIYVQYFNQNLCWVKYCTSDLFTYLSSLTTLAYNWNLTFKMWFTWIIHLWNNKCFLDWLLGCQTDLRWVHTTKFFAIFYPKVCTGLH